MGLEAVGSGIKGNHSSLFGVMREVLHGNQARRIFVPDPNSPYLRGGNTSQHVHQQSSQRLDINMRQSAISGMVLIGGGGGVAEAFVSRPFFAPCTASTTLEKTPRTSTGRFLRGTVPSARSRRKTLARTAPERCEFRSMGPSRPVRERTDKRYQHYQSTSAVYRVIIGWFWGLRWEGGGGRRPAGVERHASSWATHRRFFFRVMYTLSNTTRENTTDAEGRKGFILHSRHLLPAVNRICKSVVAP